MFFTSHVVFTGSQPILSFRYEGRCFFSYPKCPLCIFCVLQWVVRIVRIHDQSIRTAGAMNKSDFLHVGGEGKLCLKGLMITDQYFIGILLFEIAIYTIQCFQVDVKMIY